jgi:DNA-binding transcriptional LysR family regulator
VELRHLRYFVAVAELGSLAGAARYLNVAQSALSQQIQDLERELGAPLLERLPRGMRTTAAGRLFLEHARRALAEADAGAQAVREVAAGASGVLRAGTLDWGAHPARVGEAVAALRARAPGAAVALEATPWTEQPAAVAAGRIDVGFCPAVRAADLPAALHAEALDEEPVDSAVFAASHPFARRGTVSLRELAEVPMLLPERAVYPAMYDYCVAEVRRGGGEPRLVVGPPSPAAAVGLIVAGAGWMIGFRSFAAAPPPGTVVLRIEDSTLRIRLFALRRGGDTRPLVVAFLDCLRAAYGKGPPAPAADPAPAGGGPAAVLA